MKKLSSLFLIISLALISSVSAHAQTLIGSEYSGNSVYQIDGATGNFTTIGGGSTNHLPGLAYNPNTGVLYGTNEANLYTVNPSTGVASLVGAHGAQTITGLTFNSAYTVLYSIGYNGTLYSVNPATGTETAIGALGITPNTITDLATNSAGTVYATGTSGNLYTVNTSTGAASLVGATTGTSAGMTAIAFGVDDTLYGIDTITDRLMTVNIGTLVATPVGTVSIGGDVRGLAVTDTLIDNEQSAVSVPTLATPTLFALALLLGLAGLLSFRRRSLT
jgi:hypothetical protein